MTQREIPRFSNIGEMIRYVIIDLHVNVNELIKKMGVTQRYLSKLESGHLEPTRDQVDILKSFLEQS